MGKGGEKAENASPAAADKVEVLLDGQLYDVTNMKVSFFAILFHCLLA